MKKKTVSRLFSMVLVFTMIFALAACGKDDDSQSGTPGSSVAGTGEESTGGTQESNPGSDQKEEQLLTKITISANGDNVSNLDNNPLYEKMVKEISDYMGVDIEFKWNASNDYYDQLTLKLISGDVADILVGGGGDSLTSTFTTAAEQGMFWDVGPYIDDYDNLAVIPEVTRLAASYNGKMYGIPRSRNIARYGLGYRMDWLENLGLKEPTTWQEFKDMLYKFTYNDPDGNGKNDTVGLALDQWPGEWNIMMTWLGVGDTWMLDSNGDLIHKSQTPEYKAAMKEFRDLYQQGLINNGQNGIPDYMADEVPPGKARTVLLQTSMAGAGVQTVDDLRKVQDYFVSEGLFGATDEKFVFKMASYVDAGYGPRVLSFNSGMAGYLGISTRNVKTEAQLRQVLDVINKMSDPQIMDIINFGWDGITWEHDENGYVRRFDTNNPEDKAKMDAAGFVSGWTAGINQVTTFFIAPENASPNVLAPATNVQKLLEEELQAVNKQYVITNYGLGYASPTWSTNRDQLETMLNDAQNKYIHGEVDEAGFDALLESFMAAGGEKATKEINEAYHAAGN